MILLCGQGESWYNVFASPLPVRGLWEEAAGRDQDRAQARFLALA